MKRNKSYIMMKKIFLSALIITFLSVSLIGQVVVQRCDFTTGWSGSQSIAIDNSEKQEGSGALTTDAQDGLNDWFKKSFSSTQTGIDETGYLILWLYVSDASALDGGVIEISSSGGPDDKESAWTFDNTNMSNGWNKLELQISAATETGGGVNLDSVNFFRIYQNLSAPVTAKLDFVRFAPSADLPTWPVLDVDKVDASSLDGKVMFGYQGWFNHPDDGAGDGWIHWGDLYEPIRLSCDLFPDMREFGADEKYPSHFTYPDGSQVEVFSSYNQNTTIRHMKWIRDYNLDGVFIQRFISSADSPVKMDHKDTVAMNVMRGCEKYGGVFAMMWDGVANRVEDMKADWIHMVDNLKLTESDRYLHHRGLPLVSMWGYTVRDEASAAQLQEMIDFFTNNPNPKYRASIKLGVTANWYDKSEFISAFTEVDVISPWFSGTTDYDRGQAWCDQNNVDYLPVVHPGFSWHNLSLDYEEHPGSGELNRTPREGGNFLWDEVNEVLSVSSKSVYIAMFDEIDEGTAMFKCAETINDVPAERDWVTLDIDGYDLPSDWYLRVASLTSNVVRGYEDNKSVLDDLPKPEGIMTIRITDEINGADNGAMEFIFPDFPGETTIEISIDSGATWAYTTPDNVGTFLITDLPDGNYPVLVRHGSALPVVDMGHVRISDITQAPAEQANTPYPEDGATDVSLSTILGWSAGANTVSNIIYFGTTNTPDSMTYQFTPAFNPGELEPLTTYYWQIDSRNELGTTGGNLWSFTTGDGSAPKDRVVLDHCDDVTGWNAPNSMELDSENNQEGFACFTSTGITTPRYTKVFDPAVNTYADTGSYFNLWLYISDVSTFNGGGQIEIGSAGQADVDEYSWSLPDLGLVDGWNELSLPIKSAGKIGEPDLSAINWFRLYQHTSAEIVVKIDYLYFTELATIPIGVPLNIIATPDNEMVTLDWDDNTEGTLAGYNVYRTTTSGSGYTKLNTAILTLSEYTDNDVSNGTTYYYALTAVDTLGYESEKSTEVEAMPRNTAKPDAPTNLIAIPSGDTQVTLDWDDNSESDLAGYKVYRATVSGGDYWNVTTVTESTYLDKYLTTGKTYYYVIKAINDSQNESDASNEVEITPGVTSSVKEVDAKYAVNLYPNPASALATVKLSLEESSDVSVSIIDFSGRELHQFITKQNWVPGEHTVHLPLNGFRKGSYIISIQVNSEKIAKVLIIE